MRAPLVIVAFAAASLIVASPASPEEKSPASTEGKSTEGCRLRWALRERSDGASCRTCHELPDTPAGRIMRRHAGGDHNSGVVYEEALARGALRLRSISELPPEIVLVGGRVTCTTCHDPHSTAPKKIAVQGGMPALCTTCHRM